MLSYILFAGQETACPVWITAGRQPDEPVPTLEEVQSEDMRLAHGMKLKNKYQEHLFQLERLSREKELEPDEIHVSITRNGAGIFVER